MSNMETNPSRNVLNVSLASILRGWARGSTICSVAEFARIRGLSPEPEFLRIRLQATLYEMAAAREMMPVHGVVCELNGVVILEPLANVGDDALIVGRLDVQRRPFAVAANLALLDDDLARLDDVTRQFEHRLFVGP